MTLAVFNIQAVKGKDDIFVEFSVNAENVGIC